MQDFKKYINDVVSRLVEEDQKVRATHAPLKSIDRKNTTALKRLINRFGFSCVLASTNPTHVWLIIQHADHDLNWQKECLKKLRARNFDRKLLAYLADRISVNSGRRQRYGTQLRSDEGVLKPAALSNSRVLHQRRKKLGLLSLKGYIKKVSGKHV